MLVNADVAPHLHLICAPEGAPVVKGPGLHEPHGGGVYARHRLRSLQAASSQINPQMTLL